MQWHRVILKDSNSVRATAELDNCIYWLEREVILLQYKLEQKPSSALGINRRRRNCAI